MTIVDVESSLESSGQDGGGVGSGDGGEGSNYGGQSSSPGFVSSPSGSASSSLEALSESELTNAIFEMATRTTSMAGYQREFAGRRGAAKVQAELVEERRATAVLRGELEALRVAHEETGKRSAEMQMELIKTTSKLAETVDLLKKARATNATSLRSATN